VENVFFTPPTVYCLQDMTSDLFPERQTIYCVEIGPEILKPRFIYDIHPQLNKIEI